MSRKFLLFVFLLILLIILRVFYDEWENYQKGMSFLKQGKKITAVSYFAFSADSYIPYSPIFSKSVKTLEVMGDNFLKQGKLYEAMYVYENLRSSLLQSKSFYVPLKEKIENLNIKLADIKAKILMNELQCDNYDYCYNNQLKLLEEYQKGISVFWSFFACFFFVFWLVSMVVLILRKKRKNIIFYISSFLSFSLWIAGVYFA